MNDEAQRLPSEIRPATLGDVSALSRLHRWVLGYTLNAELGDWHVRNLYRGLMRSPRGIVYGSFCGAELVGFVSGTDEAALLQNDLIRTPGTRIFLSLALGLLRRPWLIGKLWTQVQINLPITHQGQVVRAELLTLGVHPNYARRGIGGQLVSALIAEFRRRRVTHFHLNTMSTNDHARAFYRALGGQLWRSWQGNDIYLFVLNDP
jgi:ribosomal protein S18 acetylase RimI-like enzyme